jgi:hypothetical protein
MDSAGLCRFLHGDPISIEADCIRIHRPSGATLTFRRPQAPPCGGGGVPAWDLPHDGQLTPSTPSTPSTSLQCKGERA